MTNGRRADRAEDAVMAWMADDRPDPTYDTAVQDLLNDLMHLCDREQIDFDHALQWARSNYEEER